jgi:cytochrome c-type biogenesis protein CcmH/NrfG
MRAFLLFLGLTFLVACGGTPEETANLTDEAAAEFVAIKATYRERNFEEAAKSLEAFLAANPEHATAWILLGNARRQMNLRLSAKEAYKKAIAIDGLRMEAFLGLGVIARKEANSAARKGKKAEARSLLKIAEGHYERALSIDSFHAETLSSMAMLQLQLKKPKIALRSAEKAWELTKIDGTIAANLAVAYHKNNLTEKRNIARDNAARLNYPGMDKLNEMFGLPKEAPPAE